jgi:hypothetical protein
MSEQYEDEAADEVPDAEATPEADADLGDG